MTTPKAKFAGLAFIVALCAGFMLGLTAPAWAAWDEAVAAYQRGDYATALREFRPLAEQGNAGAQHNLGVMYYNGHGVPQDYAEAPDGGARPPSRATPKPNSISASCTTRAWAFPRTTPRR